MAEKVSNKYARAIVNPAAGGSSASWRWSRMQRRLEDDGLLLDCVYTERTGQALELAREAADTGYGYIIAVGGDGTVNEVANGILTSAHPHDTVMGIVNAGTTCSFARSLGISSYTTATRHLPSSGNIRAVDVGLIECHREGQNISRYFVNDADIGFGAQVIEVAKSMPGRIGRRANYLPFIVGGIGSLLNYKNKKVVLRVDNGEEETYDCTMVVIANGKHFGGGMCIAPDARPDDGLLDIVVFQDMSKAEIMKLWPETYRGQHIGHDKVRLRRIKKVAVRSEESIPVEADGELVGETPASFSVVPGVLQVLL